MFNKLENSLDGAEINPRKTTSGMILITAVKMIITAIVKMMTKVTLKMITIWIAVVKIIESFRF